MSAREELARNVKAHGMTSTGRPGPDGKLIKTWEFPYVDRDNNRHIIVVEAETHDEALELAVAELLRRDPIG